jgi:PAS domain-containing protein
MHFHTKPCISVDTPVNTGPPLVDFYLPADFITYSKRPILCGFCYTFDKIIPDEMNPLMLPKFEDASQEYFARMQTIIMGVGLTASLVGIGAMFSADQRQGLSLMLLVIFALLASGYLIIRKQLRLSAWVLVSALWVGVTIFGLFASEYLLTLITSFAVVVLAAAILIGPWSATLFAILSTAMSFLIPAASARGLLPEPLFGFFLTGAAIVSIVNLMLMIGLVYLDSRRAEADREQNRRIENKYAMEILELTEERQKVEQALQESDYRMRAILESAPTGVIIVDRRGVIQFTNQLAQDLFDYSAEEMLHQPVEMVVPESSREIHCQRAKKFFPQPAKWPHGYGSRA